MFVFVRLAFTNIGEHFSLLFVLFAHQSRVTDIQAGRFDAWAAAARRSAMLAASSAMQGAASVGGPPSLPSSHNRISTRSPQTTQCRTTS
jgi:hypothetical protein